MTAHSQVEADFQLRILSLDGGGVLGLSSLLILREILQRLERREGRLLRPCEYFELIIRTGTGAISALFLGRLGMTVDEAITEYIKVAEKAFEPSHTRFSSVFMGKQALLDGSLLDRELADVVARYAGNSDAGVASVDSNVTASCHTAVLAATAIHTGSPPHVFRSYASDTRSASPFTIREVARASAATASLFPPFELGDPPVKFIDAGFAGYNNPTEVGLDEASALWPGSRVECVVSLGTGLHNVISVGETWAAVVEACRRTLESCEAVHNRMVLRKRRDDFAYFRFNVDRGLHSVDVTEWRGSGPRGNMVGITEAYTRWADVDGRLDKCVQTLIGNDACRTTDAGASLPGAPPIFHGRQNRIQTAVEIFQHEDAARLALVGAGGIGKTSIAIKILHHRHIEKKFGRERYFLSCEGIPSIPLLIDSMCATFAVPQDTANRERHCKRTEFLGVMKQRYMTRPALLVLDNFETVWDVAGVQAEVEDFLRGLGAATKLSVLMTMRGTEYPSGLRWFLPRLPEVLPLDPDAAHAAFTEICGHAYEGPQLDALLRETDYVPLVVTLMARLAQNERLAELSKRWKEERTMLLSRPRHRDRMNNVEVSIRVSLESHRMHSTPEALRLLRSISILPLGAFDNHLKSICPRIPNLKEASLTLREVALAYHDSERALRVLSPIRLYILEHYPPESDDLEDIESFHFELALQVRNQTHRDASGILTTLGQNIEAVIIHALSRSRDRGAVQAALDWTHFLRLTHHPRTEVIDAAVEFLQKQGVPGQGRLMACLYALGDTYRQLYRYEAAEIALSQARAQYEEFGDMFGVAECLWSLGGVWTLTGKYDKAEEALTRARDWYKSLGDPNRVARCLRSLGDVWRSMGRYDEAEEALTQASEQYESLGDSHNVMYCLRSLGDVWRRRGKYARAEEVLIQARDKYKTLGDLFGVARCMWSLGEVLQRKGDYDASEDVLTQAQGQYQLLGAPLGVADCLRSLGEVWRRRGKYDQAEEALTRAQDQYESLGHPVEVANCLWSLGEVWRRRAKYDEAEEALTQARARYEALGDPAGVADSLRSLGKVWRSRGKYQEAEAALTQALARYEFLGALHGIADCLWSLGMVFHGQTKYQYARDSLTQAHDMFEYNGCDPGRARSLLALGYLSRDLGEVEEAKRYFSEAKTGFEKVGHSMEREQEECIHALSGI